MKKLSLFIASLALMLGLAAPLTASAQTASESVCGGAGLTASSGSCEGDSSTLTVGKVIASAVSILSFVIGAAAVIMIVVGAFKYITSGGDSNRIGSAKQTIMYALVGLVVAALAQTIVQFVFYKTQRTELPDPAVPACQGITCGPR